MYKTSKYYSYIFYADRNVRPCMILGYTLTTFPKSRKTLMHNQSNRDLWHNCKRNKRNQRTNKTPPKSKQKDLAGVSPSLVGNIYKFVCISDRLRELNVYGRVFGGYMGSFLFWWASPSRRRDMGFLSIFDKASKV